jgi:hypothetical protein
MGPPGHLIGRQEPEGLAVSLRIPGKRAQEVQDLVPLHPFGKRHGPELVSVEPPGQIREYGMVRLCRHAFDDQLALGHADGQVASLREETGQASQELLARFLESGVISRVHGTAVHTNRELEEEIRELSGQGRRSFDVAVHLLVAVQAAGSPRMLERRRAAGCGANSLQQ